MLGLSEWLEKRGGIAHRQDILDAGFALALMRRFVREGSGTLIRRAWIALPRADADLIVAARAGGRLSCVSLAARRGWWLPGQASRPHLHLAPSAASPHLTGRLDAVVHWAKPLAPLARSLLADVEDALQHIAMCQPPADALVIWESAVRTENLSASYLQAVAWTSRVARELSRTVSELSDSGLETLLIAPLRSWRLHVRQQVVLAGRRVDILVGERLVIQIDGWQFHSSAAQRAQDIAHDAELRLRGYTVLRFGYAQVVHDRRAVERVIRRAIAARLHLAA